jgi:hypothetical protein
VLKIVPISALRGSGRYSESRKGGSGIPALLENKMTRREKDRVNYCLEKKRYGTRLFTVEDETAA